MSPLRPNKSSIDEEIAVLICVVAAGSKQQSTPVKEVEIKTKVKVQLKKLIRLRKVHQVTLMMIFYPNNVTKINI